jgi:hypothetical protein
MAYDPTDWMPTDTDYERQMKAEWQRDLNTPVYIPPPVLRPVQYQPIQDPNDPTNGTGVLTPQQQAARFQQQAASANDAAGNNTLSQLWQLFQQSNNSGW